TRFSRDWSSDVCSSDLDTSRTAYEFPERFEITGVTLGMSCLVVSGGGITDTIVVRVVPDSIAVTVADTVESGNTTLVDVTFLGRSEERRVGKECRSRAW